MQRPPIEREAAAALPTASAIRISSMQVRGLLEGLELSGVQSAAFIERTGIDTAQLADPHGWFSHESFDAFMVAAVELSRDPAFGLHWGERSPMMQFDLAPPLFASAPTLSAAIECLIMIQPVLSSHHEFTFAQQRDRGVLTIDVLGVSALGRLVRTELIVLGMVRLFRYLGEEQAIRRINLRHARPAHHAEYERLFGSLVHFEQPNTSVEFVRSALDRPQAHRNAELHQTLRTRTEQMRQQALGQLSYSEQLEQHIRATLPSLLTMADAARALEISERSLRRRLAEEKVSYSDLVERVQRRLAEELLALGTKSVKEIAHTLGFSSVSGFHRAFRRWTGGTPADARSTRARG